MAKTFLRRLLGGTVRPPCRSTNRRKRCRLGVELLEARCLLSTDPFRSVTGFGNNVMNPTWGQAGTDFIRVSPVAYADGISSPSTPNTLSARQISNALNNQSDPIFSGADNLGVPQTKSLSDFSYVWGQFIDHDMDLTKDNSGQPFDIAADPTPLLHDPMGVEPFTRSNFDTGTGTSTSNPRQQINSVTSFLDLSQVYGSTQVVADALRVTNPDGSLGFLLKTSPGNLLPFNNLAYFTQAQLDALNMANDSHQVPDGQLFAAGDRRANENIELTAMQTLFVRNHNRLAEQLHDLHPGWTDEHVYQEARKLNIATEELITYNEFLPAILGPNALPAYTGYKNNVNASIATEFSTVGFRFGHSLLSNTVGRANNDGTNITDVNPNGAGVNLTEDFFRPDLINANGVTVNLVDLQGNPDPHTSSGIGAILKADASNTANETDLLLIDEVRNILFGIPNGPGTDLAARDIQRTRDHGIGTYNQVRVAYGLPAVKSFSDITSNTAVQAQLRATYGTVDQIDPFEGMLAEDHLPGADVGPTVKAILAKQFAALRDGDRFFFLNESFNLQEIGLVLQAPTLAKVIEANTSITNLQSNVFFMTEEIAGVVYDDDNHNGVRNFGEPGLAGVTVNLNDDSGNVVATTMTDARGEYDFTDQTGIPGTGKFTMSIVLPAGFVQTSSKSVAIALSRGGLDFDAVNFGVDEKGGGLSALALRSGTGTAFNGSIPDVVRALTTSGTGWSAPRGTIAGSDSNLDGQSNPAVSPDAVASLHLATLSNNQGAPVSGASTSTGTDADSFWRGLAADFTDPVN